MKTRLALLPLILAPVSGVSAGPTVTVDLASSAAYEFEGWGTSLCWWANRVGGWREERLEALAAAITDPSEGLGLSVFRYNLGAGDDPTHDHMRPGGELECFRAGPDAPLDPEADATQRRTLLALLERAESPIVEAFSNSPPWWMTASGCSSGGRHGAPNLPAERVDQFAAYLADVALLYHERHAVTFRTLDPFNEPNEGWWAAGGKQEGCGIPQAQQPQVINALHHALRARGLADKIAISATDAHNLDRALENLQALDPATRARVGQFNTHTYRGEGRRALREFAAACDTRLWQSESGPMGLDRRLGDPRLAMMDRVALDLNDLRAAAWVMWQVVDDSPPWSCFRVDYEQQTFRPTQNFYLYSQFTRHLRPGDQIVPTADPRVVAARSREGGATIIVVNPTAEPVEHTIRVIGAKVSDEPADAWRTTRRERHAGVTVRTRGGRMRMAAPARSVTTVRLAISVD